MSPPFAWVLSALIAFTLGSLPFGLWWGRIARRIDIREHGSRNLGATNVYRVLGPTHGIAVLLLDALKGAAAVLVSHGLTGSEICALMGGLVAVLGHAFSPWASFRGGKGVATGLGAWSVLAPVATLIALLVWGIALGLTRRVSAASLLAALALPIAVAVIGPDAARVPRVCLAIVLAVLVWARHRTNLVRLSRGEEPPLWGAKRP